MEAVVFVGLQASGKSSFYREKFLHSHIRLSLDMLKTRHREHILLSACLTAKQPFVIDNTNPTASERARYLLPAKKARFTVTGYYFQSSLDECKQRNELRQKADKIPVVRILATYKKLQLPSYQEGFDRLHYVRLTTCNSFVIDEWRNEIY